MALIKISDITADDDLQPRALIKSAVVDEYADAMKRGESFPPVILFNDGTTNWLADGYHRYKAAKKAGINAISAEFRTGSKEDALRFALSANATHGLRRSQVDKRRAVLIALRQFGNLSNRELGRMVKVDDKTVGKYRERLAVVDKIKARIANGESFVGVHGETFLFVIKLDGPYVTIEYVSRNKKKTEVWSSDFLERGIHVDYVECAVCLLTKGLGMVDFDGWITVDAKEFLKSFRMGGADGSSV
ncbi:MAG TPA: ParB/RepB/Spo0J family partition protein [Methanothrix sp.]|nr:ParB/RepB/Spo0J family partition protein [Methanothrix sp.]